MHSLSTASIYQTLVLLLLFAVHQDVQYFSAKFEMHFHFHPSSKLGLSEAERCDSDAQDHMLC